MTDTTRSDLRQKMTGAVGLILIFLTSFTIASRPVFEILLNLKPQNIFFKPGGGLHSLLLLLCEMLSVAYLILYRGSNLVALRRAAGFFMVASLVILVHDFSGEALSYWVRLNFWIVPIPALALAVSEKNRATLLTSGLIAASIGVGAVVFDTAVSGGYLCPIHSVREVGGYFFTTYHHPASYYWLLPTIVMSLILLKKKTWLWLVPLALALVGTTIFSFVRLSWMGLGAFLLTLPFAFFLFQGRKSLLICGLIVSGACVGWTLLGKEARYERIKDLTSIKTFYEIAVQPTDVLEIKYDTKKAKGPFLVRHLHNLEIRKKAFGIYLRRDDWKGMGSGRAGIMVSHLQAFWSEGHFIHWLLGRGVKENMRVAGTSYTPHSNFLHLLIETGLVGLLLFGWYLWILFKALFSLFRHSSHPLNRIAAVGLALFPALLLTSIISFPVLVPQQALYVTGFLGTALSFSRDLFLDKKG